MSEVKLLIENKQISYTGLFRLDELYNLTKRYVTERSYWTVEKKHQEDIFEAGKHVMIDLESAKKYSDYAKGKILISFTIKNLKDKTITVDGHKQKYQQGDVNVTVYSYLETDYRNQWEGTGLQFLFRTISNKFIRRDVMHQWEDFTKRDTEALFNELKSYLNMSRYKLEHKEK